MGNIARFYRTEDLRQEYEFKNRPVLVVLSGSETVRFPCIGLYHSESGVPVWFPGYERWMFPLNEIHAKQTSTLKKKAFALCAFLNFLLKETSVNQINEVTINDLRAFLVAFKTNKTGQTRTPQGWEEGVSAVFEFLGRFYKHNHEILPFSYCPDDFISTTVIRDASTHRRTIVKQYSRMSVKPPKAQPKKNRLLLHDHLDLILYECKMYDPMLAIAVALQSFAGIREGEVVNISIGDIALRYAGFGIIGDIVIDLTEMAAFASEMDANRKTEFGKIKVHRTQLCFTDFTEKLSDLYAQHIAFLESQGYDVSPEAPLLRNRWGKPMSVDTYKGQVRQLFYNHFLPDLKVLCEKQGSWASNAPFIEAYETEYPGAHMFRHWFTMYLVERAGLSIDEIAKWRGDSSRDSMLAYVHVYADMLNSYKTVSCQFQRDILESII